MSPAQPVVQVPPVLSTPPKPVKPRQSVEDFDRPITPEELREANEILALGKGKYKKKDFDTAQGVKDLRRDILEGRFRATKERKRELGLLSDDKIRPAPAKTKIKTKYTKEQFEKYLETANRLDEQRKRRLADAINDVMKDTK